MNLSIFTYEDITEKKNKVEKCIQQRFEKIEPVRILRREKYHNSTFSNGTVIRIRTPVGLLMYPVNLNRENAISETM